MLAFSFPFFLNSPFLSLPFSLSLCSRTFMIHTHTCAAVVSYREKTKTYIENVFLSSGRKRKKKKKSGNNGYSLEIVTVEYMLTSGYICSSDVQRTTSLIGFLKRYRLSEEEKTRSGCELQSTDWMHAERRTPKLCARENTTGSRTRRERKLSQSNAYEELC